MDVILMRSLGELQLRNYQQARLCRMNNKLEDNNSQSHTTFCSLCEFDVRYNLVKLQRK